MTYDYMKPHTNGGVVLHYSMRMACSKCGHALGYDSDLKGVNFCPSCGHRLRQIPVNLSPGKVLLAVRNLVVGKREEGGDGG